MLKKIIIIPKPFDPLLQSQLNEANNTISGLTFNLAALQDTNSQLIADYGTLQGANNALQADITAKNNQIASLQGNIASLNNQVSSLNGQLATANNTIANLNSQIATKNNQITALNNQIATLNNQVTSLTNSNNSLTSQVNSLTSQLNQQNTILTMQWQGTFLQANTFVMTITQNGTSVIATDNKGGTYTGIVSNYNGIINGQWIGTISGMFNSEPYPSTGQTFNHKAIFDGNNILNKYSGSTTTFKGTFTQTGARQ